METKTIHSDYFVQPQSIVRQIWGKSDTILFIFAGASAEFALNKSVDWLYFTGRLPKNPIDRLFSTVAYAKHIVFSNKKTAEHAIASLTAIHRNVEHQRGSKIPDWAYRDVLFMLIDYSIRAFELLERPLNLTEKKEIFDVFYRVGNGMQLIGLPTTFEAWLIMRNDQLERNLEYSHYTKDLFIQYKKHLGFFRFKILVESQKMLIPKHVSSLMMFNKLLLLKPLMFVYKLSRTTNLDTLIKGLLLPVKYKKQMKSLDAVKS